MMDVGRVCVKIAGRDAKQLCVIVEKKDNNFVKIAGFARERLVNIRHLEPLPFEIDVSNKDKINEELLKIAEKLQMKVKVKASKSKKKSKNTKEEQ